MPMNAETDDLAETDLLAMTDHLAMTTACPDWFSRAMSRPRHSRHVRSDDCLIHYLLWDGPDADADGLLLVHGGGGHAHWWSFLAPFFTDRYRVVAPDLSGMGDSGRRPFYDADIRAAELRAVIEHAGLGPRTWVVGHSFGGLTATRLAHRYPEVVSGLVLADSPVRSSEERARREVRRPGARRVYPDFATALARFRLMPEQPCANDFLVEHIGRHSLRRWEEGWTWKFDPTAMHQRRLAEPYDSDLRNTTCPVALICGDDSVLMPGERIDYMLSLIGRNAPVIGIPEAQHHLMLDQPMAFITAVRAVLGEWARG